ncbi:MAG: CHASE3 domain-containing protein [Gammaproteobacteria bacterium]
MASRPPEIDASLIDRLRLLPASLVITLLGVLVASSVAFVLSEGSYRRTTDNAARASALLNRLDAAAEFRTLMVEAETGQRGFLLTHDAAYLQPFDKAVANFDGAFNRLRELTPPGPHLEQLNRIRQTAIQRLQDTTVTVGAGRAGDFVKAVDIVISGPGEQLMSSFLADIGSFEDASVAELTNLRESQNAGTFWPRLATVVFTLLVFGLLVAVTRLFIEEALRQRLIARDKEEEALRMHLLVDARTAELSDLSAHLQSVSEREKAELARNLHDELGGLLTAARMDLSWLQAATKALDPEIGDKLKQLNQAFAEAMDVKRRVVESLRPALLDHFGLPTALQNHFDETCKSAGLDCKSTIPEEIADLPQDLAIALFRAGQESLTNIIRHAKARNVELSVDVVDDVIKVLVRDDGVGLNLEGRQFRSSHGITGMRHRIQALGGTFNLRSSPGHGTEVEISVPRVRPPLGVPLADAGP